MEELFIIVGLGNPGTKYEVTRHNVGFLIIDMLSARHGIKVSKVKHKALTGDGNIGSSRIILVKPQTYMNLSGESVREVMEWFKTPPGNIILIYDDIDVPVGKIRVRPKGSAGTHNGMRSVLYHMQTDEFPRVRVGIGKPPEGWQLADFVLSGFAEHERAVMRDSITAAADAAEAIVKSGVDFAMNRFNK